MSSVADRFTKEAAKNASMFDWRNFADESIKRQFRNIAEQGTSAMSNTTKLERVSAVYNSQIFTVVILTLNCTNTFILSVIVEFRIMAI